MRLLHITFLVFLLGMFVWFLSFVDNRQILLTSLPHSMDKGEHGLSELRSRLSQAGQHVGPVELNYQELSLGNQQNAGKDLLFVSLPSAIPTSREERDSLATWVRNGNTIVLLLAMDDKPHWHNKQNRASVETFLSGFDLKLVQLDNPQDKLEQENRQATLITRLPVGLTHNVKTVATAADQSSHGWQLQNINATGSALILLRNELSLSPVAWLTRFGKGQIFVFTHSDLFSNAQLARADNLTLVMNLIRHSTRATSHIYFDDIHHTMTTSIPAPRLFNHPLSILIAGMLGYAILVRLLTRFRTGRGRNRITLQQFVRDTAIQQARTLPKSVVAVRYAGHFFNFLRMKYGLALNQQPLWELLRSANKNSRLIARTEKTYQHALAAKNINLHKFVKRLDKLRTQHR